MTRKIETEAQVIPLIFLVPVLAIAPLTSSLRALPTILTPVVVYFVALAAPFHRAGDSIRAVAGLLIFLLSIQSVHPFLSLFDLVQDLPYATLAA